MTNSSSLSSKICPIVQTIFFAALGCLAGRIICVLVPEISQIQFAIYTICGIGALVYIGKFCHKAKKLKKYQGNKKSETSIKTSKTKSDPHSKTTFIEGRDSNPSQSVTLGGNATTETRATVIEVRGNPSSQSIDLGGKQGSTETRTTINEGSGGNSSQPVASGGNQAPTGTKTPAGESRENPSSQAISLGESPSAGNLKKDQEIEKANALFQEELGNWLLSVTETIRGHIFDFSNEKPIEEEEERILALRRQLASAQGKMIEEVVFDSYTEALKCKNTDWVTARILFRRAADDPKNPHSGDACTELGHIFAKGLGIDKDIALAFHYYKEALEKNASCKAFLFNYLGLAYMKGVGTHKDILKAIASFESAINEGEDEAVENLEKCYRMMKDQENAKAALLKSTKTLEKLLPPAMGGSDQDHIIDYCNDVAIYDEKERILALRKKLAKDQGKKIKDLVIDFYDEGVKCKNTDWVTARIFFRLAAHDPKNSHAGDAWAELGRIYNESLGVGRDLSIVFHCFQEAINKNTQYKAFVLHHLGWAYETGSGTCKNIPKAIISLKSAINEGRDDAAVNLKECYRIMSAREKEKTKNLSATEVRQKWLPSCLEKEGISECIMDYCNEKVTYEDEERILELKEKLAKARGCKIKDVVINFYIEGRKHKENDWVTARALFKRVADDPKNPYSGDACAELGTIFDKGWGVGRDAVLAFHYYQEAIKKNTQYKAFALHHLGFSHMNGIGAGKNITQAIAYLESAISEGRDEAADNLLTCYENKNQKEKALILMGKRLFALSGKKKIKDIKDIVIDNHPYIQGLRYKDGIKVPQDWDRAEAFFERVISLPDDPCVGDAYAELALIHYTAPGKRVRNLKKSLDYFEAAIRKNSNFKAYAAYMIGKIHMTGSEGFEQDIDKAIISFTDAVQWGRVESEEDLMQCYQIQKAKEERYIPVIEQSLTLLNYNVDIVLDYCFGEMNSSEHVVGLPFKKLFREGNSKDFYGKAMKFKEKKEWEKARVLFKYAMNDIQEADKAAAELGNIYFEGLGTPVRLSKAFNYYTLAVKEGAMYRRFAAHRAGIITKIMRPHLSHQVEHYFKLATSWGSHDAFLDWSKYCRSQGKTALADRLLSDFEKAHFSKESSEISALGGELLALSRNEGLSSEETRDLSPEIADFCLRPPHNIPKDVVQPPSHGVCAGMTIEFVSTLMKRTTPASEKDMIDITRSFLKGPSRKVIRYQMLYGYLFHKVSLPKAKPLSTVELTSARDRRNRDQKALNIVYKEEGLTLLPLVHLGEPGEHFNTDLLLEWQTRMPDGYYDVAITSDKESFHAMTIRKWGSACYSFDPTWGLVKWRLADSHRLIPAYLNEKYKKTLHNHRIDIRHIIRIPT